MKIFEAPIDWLPLDCPLQDLAEGPVWFSGAFYWTNITAGEIWKWIPPRSAEAAPAPPERILKCESMVGAFCFDAQARLILLTTRGIEVAEAHALRLIRPVAFREGGRFNDCILDAEGRLLAGTLFPDRRGGELLSFAPDGSGGYLPAEPLLKNLGISNGMDFTADGRFLYHTDTATARIGRYDYDPETGALGPERGAVGIAPENGGPDGMTLDGAGRIWTAAAGSS